MRPRSAARLPAAQGIVVIEALFVAGEIGHDDIVKRDFIQRIVAVAFLFPFLFLCRRRVRVQTDPSLY